MDGHCTSRRRPPAAVAKAEETARIHTAKARRRRVGGTPWSLRPIAAGPPAQHGPPAAMLSSPPLAPLRHGVCSQCSARSAVLAVQRTARAAQRVDGTAPALHACTLTRSLTDTLCHRLTLQAPHAPMVPPPPSSAAARVRSSRRSLFLRGYAAHLVAAVSLPPEEQARGACPHLHDTRDDTRVCSLCSASSKMLTRTSPVRMRCSVAAPLLRRRCRSRRAGLPSVSSLRPLCRPHRSFFPRSTPL